MCGCEKNESLRLKSENKRNRNKNATLRVNN